MVSILDFFWGEHGLPLGEIAPALAAIDQFGSTVKLAAEYTRGPVLIYFYVRADTPICTAHACRMRDRFELLRRNGIQVIGVSGDSPARLERFAEKHRLPFRLLADADGAIAAGFEVPTLFGITARDAYLVRHGRIAWKGRASDRMESMVPNFVA